MVQAVDRLRLIHSPREKTVVILCNIPLDLPVDELVTWRELAGDDRLEEAPALREEVHFDFFSPSARARVRLKTQPSSPRGASIAL